MISFFSIHFLESFWTGFDIRLHHSGVALLGCFFLSFFFYDILSYFYDLDNWWRDERYDAKSCQGSFHWPGCQ